MSDENLRDRLRAVRTPQTELPVFDTTAAPADPLTLFGQWLDAAVEAGVQQLNAVTLSTASASGVPSARTLLLKDVTDEGFWFATLTSGPKGADLRENPRAALTLYWREQGRQVRVYGEVRPGPREVSEQDFLARHPVARAQAIAGEQSQPMPGTEQVAGLLASARELILIDPQFVPETWSAFVIEPQTVEFWQAAAGNEQVRLRYRREMAGPISASGWARELLWP